jgi:hypothetical protein
LAVSGTSGIASFTALTRSYSNGVQRSRPEPAFCSITLCAGQPKFRSRKSGRTRSQTSRAARAIEAGVAPKICTPIGRWVAVKSTISHALALSRIKASDWTNSVTMTSAPCSLQSCRKAMSVRRAIGAR